MNGQDLLIEEKRNRLLRMIEGLRFDLMTRTDLTQEARKEAFERLKRWEADYAAH